MTDYEKLQQAVEILRKLNLPISPILEYSINEKLQELSYQVESSSASEDIISTPEPARPGKYYLRTGLRVTRPDGSIIQEEKAANTLCQVIKEVGPEKVYNLHIPLDGNNLVIKGENPDKHSGIHYIGDNYYVNTHSNTISKKRQLERIFQALNLGWKVDIV
jgi:hypothetical protein